MNNELMKDFLEKHPEIRWYYNIYNINRKIHGEDENEAIDVQTVFEQIPENERDMYIINSGDIKYNWNGIYCKLFNKSLSYNELVDVLPIRMKAKDIKVPTCDIPSDIAKIFETDKNGNSTGKFNWDYAIDIINTVSQAPTVDSQFKDDITYFMPEHIGLVMENLDDASELFEILSTGGTDTKTGVDSNCPKIINDNFHRMLDIFSYIKDNYESEYINSFWELASDRLKSSPEFITSLFELLGEDDFEYIEEFTGKSKNELIHEAQKRGTSYDELSPSDLEAILELQKVQNNSKEQDLRTLQYIELKRMLDERLVKPSGKKDEEIQKIFLIEEIKKQQKIGKELDLQLAEARKNIKGSK